MTRAISGLRWIVAMLILGTAGSPAVLADTVYSNFGPQYSDSGNAVNVAGDNYGGEYYKVSFTPSMTVTFTDAVTDLLWFTGQQTVDAFLLSDNNGLPGAPLLLLDQTTLVDNGLETFTCASNCPILEAGSVYWLELQETEPDTALGWYLSSLDLNNGTDNALSYTYYGPNSGIWWPTGPRNVFQINGTPLSLPPILPIAPASAPDSVPEPSSFIMLLTGIVMIASVTWLVKKKKERAHALAYRNGLTNRS